MLLYINLTLNEYIFKTKTSQILSLTMSWYVLMSFSITTIKWCVHIGKSPKSCFSSFLYNPIIVFQSLVTFSECGDLCAAQFSFAPITRP